jgi:DNA repair exonuclease SbcCD ATPase subunit
MTIDGFEVESWACIKKLTVSGLPRTGVIVLHGPNRTGKSSLVQALRACLMDYSSTSAALKSSYPRGSGEKPTVTVTFTAGGTTYRIKKCFGSNKSELASRTSTGAWKVETTTAAEAHRRVCELAGGDDSSKGLRQLLWLTQAEFRLPDPKKFDAGVQSQLRGILGVLQTPLDDRFIERVKKRWNTWHSGQRKVGKTSQVKDSCTLAENLNRLAAAQAELNDYEAKFSEIEALLRQSGELEVRRNDLERQLGDQASALKKCQEERDLCQGRIAARRLAEQKLAHAEKEQAAARHELRQRSDAAKRLSDPDYAIEPAQLRADSMGQEVKSAVDRLDRLREDLDTQRDKRQGLQAQANRVAAKQKALRLGERLESARRDYERAKAIDTEINEIEEYLANHRAPDDEALKALKANRQRSAQLRADQKAASISLRLSPEPGASTAELAIDGAPPRKLQLLDAARTEPVRRKAELIIPSWGRVEVKRGVGSGDLEEVEQGIQECDEEFANAVNPFGITATDPNALDSLMQRAAENRQRLPEVARRRKELTQLAPQGLNRLHAKVIDLQTKLADAAGAELADSVSLPTDQAELEMLAGDVKHQLESKDSEITALEDQAKEIEAKLEGLRKEETEAREELAKRKAKVNSGREELARMRTEEHISQRVDGAERDLAAAQKQLEQTELTAEEATIDERLTACADAVKALEQQIRETDEKYNRIRGRLEGSEGLHAKRSLVAARVDELTRLTDRETLERGAVDRLYELFEECRERQLGTLMGPVHDRVVNWMRVLDIGDYKEMRFGDAFLPEKLVRRDGTAEFTVDEESTGAQEQIGMLVRLALGSILTSATEPAVAILDDPLTHCDVGRLNKMRLILRRASAGDPDLTPPAGPLQIIVLTCHPEWFRDEHATVIDLENVDVMRRLPG